MSVVTSVILTCSLIDSGENSVDSINQWLVEKRHSPLEQVSDSAGGGSKFMQCAIWIGAFNELSDVERELIECFRNVKWALPDQAMLVLYPEDGSVEAYRPN